jgi:hypothetical protein
MALYRKRLRDHQRRTENCSLRVRAEHQPEESCVPVVLLRDEFDPERVVNRRDRLTGLARGLFDLRQLGLGLLDAAVGHQPPRAFGEGASDDDHDEREQRAHEERQAPADIDGERVQEDQRCERADDGAGPVGAVDPDVDAPAVLRRHHLVDRGVDRRVLAADAHARDQPRRVEEHEPAGVMTGDERGQPGAEQVQQEGDDEQPAPAELVRQPAEHERTHQLADQVDRRDQANLGRRHVERRWLGEDADDRAGDRDLQAVEDPGGAEACDHAGVER